MKFIRFHNIDHFTQFVFWLDTMVGTEAFSVTTFVCAALFYVWLRLTVR
jgi:hypothetical protein